MTFDPYLDDSGPLVLNDAVAALLLNSDGRYLLQRRDSIPGIFFPGHWGLFGGAIEPGETEQTAVARELAEELELVLDEALLVKRFTCIDFDVGTLGSRRFRRTLFEIRLRAGAENRLVLHEGADIKSFDPREVLSLTPITPYDALGLWLHIQSDRLCE